MKDLDSKIKNFINDLNPDTLKILKFGNMLPTIVKNFLVYEIASMVSIEKNVRENEIKNFYLKNNINNNKTLTKFLKAKKLKKEELNYQITLPSKIYKFAEENLKNELNEYFLKKKGFLDEYTFNIIRVKKSDLAHELYFQLDSGESDFFKLSQRYSFYSPLYPEGVFGPRNLDGVNPIIINKLFNSTIGNLIMPFQVDEWWLIIKLLEKKQAKLDKKITKMLLIEIFNNYVKKLTQIFLENHIKLD
tara:strand:- start:1001 stop:1741 length:741 start_codon:yes stop_codon:yes gene_type:complete